MNSLDAITLTISPDFGRRPCHLGIALARSTYAALEPVPSITAATTSLSSYLPPANVPIVSFTYIRRDVCTSRQQVIETIIFGHRILNKIYPVTFKAH